MTSQQDTELEKILYAYRFDTQAINEDLVLQQNPDAVEKQHQEITAEAIQALTAWKDKEVKKAQLGMIEYYDQVPSNKDMDWKGLFADNRQQIQYELESLQSQGGKNE